jgi:hypothetical protein
VIAHFADRFPKMNIVIESARGVFFSVQGKRAYSKGNAQEIIAKIAEFGNPEIARQFSDFSNGLWEQYYSAQFISQRENLKLRNARVPKRYHSKGTTPDAMQSKLF